MQCPVCSKLRLLARHLTATHNRPYRNPVQDNSVQPTVGPHLAPVVLLFTDCSNNYSNRCSSKCSNNCSDNTHTHSHGFQQVCGVQCHTHPISTGPHLQRGGLHRQLLENAYQGAARLNALQLVCPLTLLSA